MNIYETRETYRAFLKQAAKSQDAKSPMKALAQTGRQDDIRSMEVFGMLRVHDVTDEITVTIEGRMFAGMIVGDVPDFGPGKLAELKGSITETELVARYCEGKIAGIERQIKERPHDRGQLQWMGIVLKTMVDEFRMQMHVPSVLIEGRVIPYNDDNETGIKHAANLRLFFSDVHERNVRAGWWSDLETGEAKKRSPGEMLMLMVTEMAEGYDAWLASEPDDKLPEYPGFPVEMADVGIRWADFCGAMMAGRIIQPDPAHNPGDLMFREIIDIARKYEAIRKTPAAIGQPEHADFLPSMDVATMTDAKLAFNAKREDHKVENRLKEDGKRT